MDFEREMTALFPQLTRQVRGRPLVYLDSAATAMKPVSVVDAVSRYLREGAANVHRAAHFLSDEATEKYEQAREKAGTYVGARSKNEIVFTRGTTEGLNLLARSLGSLILNEGDEIVLSQMEHHSNIVPWHMIASERRARVRFVPVRDDGTLDFDAYKGLLSERTKIVSLVHLSNAIGTLNPLADFFREARRVGAVCIADVAQSAATGNIDVSQLGCDFLAFSGHKVFGPTGVGVLYGREEWLAKMPPYQGGGSMISEVREDGVEYLAPPLRFEAGTPPIAEIIGLSAALDFVNSVGAENIRAHEKKIMKLAESELSRIPGVKFIGNAPSRAHVLSFLVEGTHPSDVGAILDEQGIAVRAGHHCCQPLMRRFSIPGTIRASFSVYTRESDIHALAEGVRKARELLV